LLLNEMEAELLYRINLNGIYGMHRTARQIILEGKTGSRNTSYFDCVIGNRITSMALEIFEGKVPETVYSFIKNHHSHEVCHCRMGPSYVPVDFAERVALFHRRIMAEHGIVSYFACMPLLGERMALATAFFGRSDDDPHTTIVGFLDEFYHCTAPLVLLALLGPTEEQLRQAIKDQEEFMNLCGVIEMDKLFPRTHLSESDLEYCTVQGREHHNV
jgi:hypothetical protein